MSKEQTPPEQVKIEQSKYELDEVQNHFQWSNEPLIDGLPMSVYLKNQALKKGVKNDKSK
jgi:hypothetical protein